MKSEFKLLQKLPLILAILMTNSCVNTQLRGPSQASTENSVSAEACAKDEAYPRLFNVLENNSKYIKVELGDFAKFFKFSDSKYTYKVIYKGSKENKDDKEITALSGSSEKPLNQIQVPVLKTGVYKFLIFENESSDPVWKQKVFAVAPAEDTLSEIDKKLLAENFAPLIQYHTDEKYSPVSFEYLLNEIETDNELQNEPFILKAKQKKGFFSLFSKPELNVEFKFKDIRKVLPFYGHADSVLKSGLKDSFDTRLVQRYGENHKTVYYSVFENKKWNEIYINYHFFYSFDPKNSTDDKLVMASHIFDRESITVVLRGTTKKPLSVFFGAHLASQTMAHLDENDNVIQDWQTGRVFVNWPDLQKQGDHPVAVAALGSHGMYPVAGNYSVMLGKIKILREPAGGGKYIYPTDLSADISNSLDRKNHNPYVLKSLNLKDITSDCAKSDNILAFSGSTVDVLGPVNATFPPFTDREEDYFSYADPNAPMFVMPNKKSDHEY